jgi:hypothetical protein
MTTLREAAQQAKQTPLIDLLERVPENARLMIDEPDGLGSTNIPAGRLCRDAAAALRRLHAENASLKRALAASCDEERDQIWEASPGGGCSRARNAEAVNAELLEALKDALFRVANQGDVGVDQWLACERKARAAIAKAEGQK